MISDAALAAWPERFTGFRSVPLGLGRQQTAAIVEREGAGRGLRRIGEPPPPPGGAGLKEIPDRILFGSDAPYGDPVLTRALVERVTSPGEVRDRVLGGTIAEPVGLG
ncbi:hypothetical protein ABZ871_36260 [Streptomyces populi]